MSEQKSKVFVFIDGTMESQVLEFESLKNPFIQIEKVKVGEPNPRDIEASYIQRLPKSVLNSNDITKVFLHFTQEDFSQFAIDQQRNEIRNKYPNLSIFFALEHMTRASAKYRHQGYYPQQYAEAKEVSALDRIKEAGDESKLYKELDTDPNIQKFKKKLK